MCQEKCVLFFPRFLSEHGFSALPPKPQLHCTSTQVQHPAKMDSQSLAFSSNDELLNAARILYSKTGLAVHAAVFALVAIYHIIRFKTTADRLGYAYLAFLGLFPVVQIVASFLGFYTIYIGLPRTDIGNLLPRSCKASFSIEGPNGWPCRINRFLTAILRRLDEDYEAGGWLLKTCVLLGLFGGF